MGFTNPRGSGRGGYNSYTRGTFSGRGRGGHRVTPVLTFGRIRRPDSAGGAEHGGSVSPPAVSWRDLPGPYVPAIRRQHKDTLARPFPPPTADYLAASQQPSESLPVHVKQDPPFLALSLAHTLLARIQRNSFSARTPVVRPFLSTFLEYICGADEGTGRPRFYPVIFSSALQHNVLAMLSAIDLITAIKLEVDSTGRIETTKYKFEWEHGDVLSKIATREDFGLATADLTADIATVKDLTKALLPTAEEAKEPEDGSIAVGLPSSHEDHDRTAREVVLVDEDEGASAQQPYNHLLIPPFLLNDSDYPSGVETFIPWEKRPPTTDGIPLFKSPTALELDEDHPLADDPALLVSIYLLERLRRETNISSAMRSGFVDKIREEVKANIRAVEAHEADSKDIEAELAARGRQVCERLEIGIDRRWKPDWRVKMLEKEGRKVIDLAAVKRKLFDEHARKVRIAERKLQQARLAVELEELRLEDQRRKEEDERRKEEDKIRRERHEELLRLVAKLEKEMAEDERVE